MGLEEVKQDILDVARKDVDDIMQKARDEVRNITGEAYKNCDELQKKFKEEMQDIKKAMKIKETASAQLEAKRKLLEAKNDVITQVFQKVSEHISTLEKKEREMIIQNLLGKASQEIDIGTVRCNKKDTLLVKAPKIEEQESIGGLTAVSKDGTVLLDYTFESMLEQLHEQYLGEISKILFK